MRTQQIVAASADLDLKNSFPDDVVVSRWIVDIKETSGGGTFAVTPKKRVFIGATITVPQGGAVNNAPNDFTATWYYNALAGPTVVTAGTALAAAGIMDIDSSGCETRLSITISGGAILVVNAVPVLG